MKPKPGGGNGSGKFDIRHLDMGGWVRVSAEQQIVPEDLPVFLSQSLSEWFRMRPHLRMRNVIPIQKDGNTVELHAWYETHVFAAIQGPQPESQKAD